MVPPCCPLLPPHQESIKLAKKDWELSHLQNLRAEEERLAEQEAEDVLLTYDRPETANKVILRRRPSTGTWEICFPDPQPQPQPPLSSSQAKGGGRREGKRSKVRRRGSRSEHKHRGQEKSLVAGELREEEEAVSACNSEYGSEGRWSVSEGLKEEEEEEALGAAVSEESPLPVGGGRAGLLGEAADSAEQTIVRRDEEEGVGEGSRDEDSVARLNSISVAAGGSLDNETTNALEPPYGIHGNSAMKTTPNTTGESAPIAVPTKWQPKSPHLSSESKTLPPPPPPVPNHVSDDCISSRTRNRLPSSSSPSSSLEVEKSPNHKYPTRHRLQQLAS